MKKLIIFVFSVLLLGSCAKEGCTDPLAINYDADATKDNGSCEIVNIGDTHQGGILFYLDGNGGGLVAANEDQIPSGNVPALRWGCSGVLIIGSNGVSVGTGNQNTIDIELGCTTPETAADICSNLSIGGYSDWYLPSKDELNLIWENLADSDGDGNNIGMSDSNNLGGLDRNHYWSSSQIDNYSAWQQTFSDGNQSDCDKGSLRLVRAIRAFYPPPLLS